MGKKKGGKNKNKKGGKKNKEMSEERKKKRAERKKARLEKKKAGKGRKTDEGEQDEANCGSENPQNCKVCPQSTLYCGEKELGRRSGVGSPRRSGGGSPTIINQRRISY